MLGQLSGATQAIPGHSEGADSSGALADAWLVGFTGGSGVVVEDEGDPLPVDASLLTSSMLVAM